MDQRKEPVSTDKQVGKPESGVDSAANERRDVPTQGEVPQERRRTVSFVLIFVGCVMLLLTGYRFATDTRANDWYLFHVAKHTTWALEKIGHKAEQESTRESRIPPAEVRARTAAWQRGEDAPTPEDIARFSNEPLTAWDRWVNRAEKARHTKRVGIVGPRVSFILRPGLTHELQALEKRQQALPANETLSGPEKRAQRAQLNEEMAALREEVQTLTEQGGQEVKKRGYFFHFIVVPECGAIEVMAIFLAAVLAFPTLWWKKLIGALVGVPIMYLVNIFRLTCLGIIGALDHGGDWFQFSHQYVWQAIYIVFVVAVWLAWVELIVRRQTWVESRAGRLGRRGDMILRPLAFCTKFLVCVTALVVLWWLAIPYYGYLLLQVSGGILKYIVGMPIAAGWIEPGGVLNTDTWMHFLLEGDTVDKMTPLALLVTNVPPYLALVLATRGLRLWKRLRVLLYGTGILALGHILFIVIVLRFQESLQQYSELPTAVIQFYLTMPFLLWIIFAYWDRITGAQDSQGPNGNSKPEPPSSDAPANGEPPAPETS